MNSTESEFLFLDLLASGATAAEIERAANEARQSRPKEQAAVDAARRLALRVNALLQDLERRDRELSALFDTANDLASLQHLDDVLRSIAERARRLLGSDVAYLSLVNEDATGTYIRVAAGSVSYRLQNLHLPLGVGIGGVVASRGRPFQTANYPEDSSLLHEQAVDDAVIEEGLTAILGVPLIVAGEVIGVLFAAHRKPYNFSHEETALLSSLATHAALALEKTRLFQEATSALENLSEANRKVKANALAVERAADAHERLTELVLRGGGVAEVAEAVVAVLGGSVVIYDAEMRLLAAVGSSTPEQPPPEVQQALDRLESARSVLVGDWWVAAAVAGAERLGFMSFLPSAPLPEADRRLVERAAMVTALLLMWRKSLVEAEVQTQGDVLRDVLTSPLEQNALMERARRLGVNLSQAWYVMFARTDSERRSLTTAAARLARPSGGVVAEQDDGAVLLVAQVDPRSGRDVALALASRLTQQTGQNVTVGVAGPAMGLAALRVAYNDARRCAQALVALGRAGEAADASELGFAAILLAGDRNIGDYVNCTLGPVMDYDARRGTELLQTLRAYFEHDRKLQHAAKSLHLHPNTLSQRLDRVARLLGNDWRTPARSLEIQLALQLATLGQPNSRA